MVSIPGLFAAANLDVGNVLNRPFHCSSQEEKVLRLRIVRHPIPLPTISYRSIQLRNAVEIHALSRKGKRVGDRMVHQSRTVRLLAHGHKNARVDGEERACGIEDFGVLQHLIGVTVGETGNVIEDGIVWVPRRGENVLKFAVPRQRN